MRTLALLFALSFAPCTARADLPRTQPYDFEDPYAFELEYLALGYPECWRPDDYRPFLIPAPAHFVPALLHSIESY